MSTTRDVGWDAARGAALLSMFVAHFAPSDGPAKILVLSEHLTAFLFVLLIGGGAEFGRRSPHRWRSVQVRAAALIILGLLLAQLPSQILVVLVWLGVMTVLATWLVMLPTWALIVAGAAGVVLSPTLKAWGTAWLVSHTSDPISQAAVWVAVADPAYRLVGFLAPVCAGALLVRHVHSQRVRGNLVAVSTGIAVAIFALDKAGTASLDAYSGSRQEVLFNTALAVLAVALIGLLAPHLPSLARALAAIGVLTLTIYTLQILGDWAYLKAGALDDDSWTVLAVACVGSLALALIWLPVARRTGFRGPLEGPLDVLARGRSRRPADTPVAS